MFTGIIENTGNVKSLEVHRLSIESPPIAKGLDLGNSIAVNGSCLTIVKLNETGFEVDLSEETLNRTNLGMLQKNQTVNLEKAMSLDGQLGGHIVQGHIDGTAKITSKTDVPRSIIFEYLLPKRLMPYIVEKGFVALDGISLTVVSKFSSSITVSVIPYSERNTNLKTRLVGDIVNLEVDVMAKYVESLMKAYLDNSPTKQEG